MTDKSQADVFREGLFARALGRWTNNNPYWPGDLEFDFWLAGWSAIDDAEDRYSPPLRLEHDEN